MPGTKNRATQPPANARLRAAAHRERQARNHRKPSPERQARLHPSRARREWLAADPTPVDVVLSGASPFDDIHQYRFDRVERKASGVQIVRNQDPKAFDVDAVIETIATPHPLPWRAPDVKTADRGWHVLDAEGHIAEYAKSRDKARARVKEVNGS